MRYVTTADWTPNQTATPAPPVDVKAALDRVQAKLDETVDFSDFGY